MIKVTLSYCMYNINAQLEKLNGVQFAGKSVRRALHPLYAHVFVAVLFFSARFKLSAAFLNTLLCVIWVLCCCSFPAVNKINLI